MASYSACEPKFHERNLPTEIECGYQSIISGGDFEAYAITIKHFGFRGGLANVVH